MKKASIFLTVLLIMALFAFVGCGTDNSVLDPDTPNRNGVTDVNDGTGLDNLNDNAGVNDNLNNTTNNGVNNTTNNGVNDNADDLTHKITDGAVQ